MKRRMKRWIICLSLTSYVLAGCVITQQQATPNSSATPEPPATATDLPLPILATNTRVPTAEPETSALPPLAFESNRDGTFELYAIYPDGSGLQQLTEFNSDSGVSNGSPAWSPDGSRIAYSSRTNGDWDIYALSADGLYTENLTALEGEDDKASWSPDGAWIAFNSRREGARWADIWLMNADGSAPMNLTRHPDDDREPVWSPSGMELAFRSFRDGNYDLYLMERLGSAARQLTQTDPPVWNGSPAWSPDGAWIAFETNRDGDWNVYLMDNNGGQLRNLTPNTADDKEPAWSPDGQFLAFSSTRDGNVELYTLELATGSVRRLTYDCAGDYNPTWRSVNGLNGSGDPVGQAVAYVARETPNLRSGPGTEFESLGGAAVNECLTITGRTASGIWLRVRTSAGRTAWVTRELLTIQGDLDAIPVAEA